METASSLDDPIGNEAGQVAEALRRGLDSYRGAGPASSREPASGCEPASGREPAADLHEPLAFESSVTPPLGGGGDVFYDDNAWVALALLEHHRLHRDPLSLELARRVVVFCCTGWSDEPGWSDPGGIRWKVAAGNRSRNTCANAPVAEAAALVHAMTGDASVLQWAVRIYGWVRGALLGADGLYLDRVMPDGTRAPDRWTYNQGTMVGAGVLLFAATGEARYLEEAGATAAAALERFDVATLMRPNGPAFNAIFFRNLLLLDRHRPDRRVRELASAYGDAAWAAWIARPGASGRLGARRFRLNSTAPLLELYALLAGAPPHP